MRVPKHIGIIPDGNRRWAVNNNLSKEKGYDYGVNPGLQLFKLCQKENIEEVTFYGYTVDNTKRPTIQKEAFIKACVESVMLLTKEDCEILVVGDSTANYFPKELIPFTKERKKFGKGGIKVSFNATFSKFFALLCKRDKFFWKIISCTISNYKNFTVFLC